MSKHTEQQMDLLTSLMHAASDNQDSENAIVELMMPHSAAFADWWTENENDYLPAGKAHSIPSVLQACLGEVIISMVQYLPHVELKTDTDVNEMISSTMEMFKMPLRALWAVGVKTGIDSTKGD